MARSHFRQFKVMDVTEQNKQGLPFQMGTKQCFLQPKAFTLRAKGPRHDKWRRNRWSEAAARYPQTEAKSSGDPHTELEATAHFRQLG